MRIYLWTALRIMDLRIKGFKNHGFENDGFENDAFENQWFLKEGFEVEIFLFLATEGTEIAEVFVLPQSHPSFEVELLRRTG